MKMNYRNQINEAFKQGYLSEQGGGGGGGPGLGPRLVRYGLEWLTSRNPIPPTIGGRAPRGMRKHVHNMVRTDAPDPSNFAAYRDWIIKEAGSFADRFDEAFGIHLINAGISIAQWGLLVELMKHLWMGIRVASDPRIPNKLGLEFPPPHQIASLVESFGQMGINISREGGRLVYSHENPNIDRLLQGMMGGFMSELDGVEKAIIRYLYDAP